jgi:hypothetical protein
MSGASKLSRKQEALIAALRTEPTDAAASKAGGNEAVAHRWLHLPVEGLGQRVAACWPQLHDADAILVQEGHKPALGQGEYQRARNRAHNRCLYAIRTPAVVRKPTLPVP